MHRLYGLLFNYVNWKDSNWTQKLTMSQLKYCVRIVVDWKRSKMKGGLFLIRRRFSSLANLKTTELKKKSNSGLVNCCFLSRMDKRVSVDWQRLFGGRLNWWHNKASSFFFDLQIAESFLTSCYITHWLTRCHQLKHIYNAAVCVENSLTDWILRTIIWIEKLF